MGIRTVINRISGLPAQVAEALGVTVVSAWVDLGNSTKKHGMEISEK